jgi:glycerol-3-phosphate acyltransferase PlsY
LSLAIVSIVSYLIGSIPFGYLIVRANSGTDVRETGSGGTGATNVSRRAGKLAGVMTLLLDAGKGAIAIVIANWLRGVMFGSGWMVIAAALLVIVGHCFPVWLGFRGGKGVATGVGVFLVLSPFAVALIAVLFLVIVWWKRYISLGSITAAAALPLAVRCENAFIRPIPEVAAVMFAAIGAAALIMIMHRGNISRLLAGTESRFR